MIQSKDPFEVTAEEREESPHDSPAGLNETKTEPPSVQPTDSSREADVDNNSIRPSNPQKTTTVSASTSAATAKTVKNKEDDDEEEEENMDVELGKVPSSSDPDKMAKMQSILSQFTEGQMSRYESFRRSGFQKSVMKRLLGSITGSNKTSMPMTIVVSGIAKIFAGELVETERKKIENTMMQSKDPFEVTAEEREESPHDSPAGLNETKTEPPFVQPTDSSREADVDNNSIRPSNPQKTTTVSASTSAATAKTVKNKEDDDEEEEENMDVELGKVPSSSDPDKMAKMQSILSQFTEGQMSRYESFRRSGFQKSVMKRLLGSITGSNKISMPMTIVVSGIAKIFVGELVETAKVVMIKRKETGPIRPCHIREAYRRLKLEGKIPKRTVQRLFR